MNLEVFRPKLCPWTSLNCVFVSTVDCVCYSVLFVELEQV